MSHLYRKVENGLKLFDPHESYICSALRTSRCTIFSREDIKKVGAGLRVKKYFGLNRCTRASEEEKGSSLGVDTVKVELIFKVVYGK